MIPFSQDNLLVFVALGLVALLALLTIIGMVKGARLKSARRAAEKQEEARIDDLRESGVEERTSDQGMAGLPAAPDAGPASTLAPSRPAPQHDTPQRDTPQHDTPAPADAGPAPATPPAMPRATDAQDDEPAQAPTADEPIAAAAPLGASPASVAADVPVADDAPPADRSITQLKGLGPKIAARLSELGITTVDQLAWLDDAEAERLDAQLGAFQGRMERDRWREQARFLAQGDRAGYEAQFGKLG